MPKHELVCGHRENENDADGCHSHDFHLEMKFHLEKIALASDQFGAYPRVFGAQHTYEPSIIVWSLLSRIPGR